jgi:hypothetical protein
MLTAPKPGGILSQLEDERKGRPFSEFGLFPSSVLLDGGTGCISGHRGSGYINSPGGDISAAMAIGRMFRQETAFLQVDGVCISAFVPVLAGAVNQAQGSDCATPVFWAILCKMGVVAPVRSGGAVSSNGWDCLLSPSAWVKSQGGGLVRLAPWRLLATSGLVLFDGGWQSSPITASAEFGGLPNVNHQNLSSFIWSVADLLRGDYTKPLNVR